jgi:DNA-binding helix-hairpin-helix protein with protein kinase domain
MNRKITLSNGVNVEFAKTPFASGGEADVYDITSPPNYSHQVLKIYKQDKRTKYKEEKLNFLIKNKPNLSSHNGHHSVVWPIHVAYQNNSFLGYTMPKATGIKLELLCHPKLPKSLPPDWNKFSFSTPGAVDLRMKLCYNIAAALAQVHSIGSYVLVDMKPDNVIIRPDGLISIIDIDSTEIVYSNQVLFPAQVATPEYTPPEFYTSLKDIEKNLIPETWDRFSLSIIFYRLLLGIHPYTGSLKPPHESLTNVSDLIQKGFFPCGRHKEKFRTIPPPHNNFFRISKQIQHLFLTTFEESHSNVTLRPSADDWCKVLSPEPFITIDRNLPSRLTRFFLNREVVFNEIKKTSQIKLHKPIYLKAEKSENFLIRIKKLLFKSEKEIALNLILQTQKTIDTQYGLIRDLYNRFLEFMISLITWQKET